MADGGLRLTRREFYPVAALAVGAACSRKPRLPLSPPGNSAVFVAKAASYAAELERPIEEGLRACGLDVRGKNVLLKPNLVEFDASTSINTHTAVIAAAFAVFTKVGAATVRIAEGPGHRRDTLFLAEQAGYRHGIAQWEKLFIDLNRDDVSAVRGFAGRGEFFFPNAALDADLIVSLAKMKTHHWAGATLSMKNFFGLVPGAVYGWPKNILHHIGIANSIVALNKTFRKTFAIVDGIVGMEGNGPIQGTPKQSGVLIMGADLPAVDATCCRIMGIDPLQLEYMRLAAELGHIEESRIEQRGENALSVRAPFTLIKEFQHVRLA
ncbi:MAG: DUF362 domain-containing protein [Candidatus Solibacter usitatus]|nr:DUF362 domain-containing protein [Candidatus Solibacter usitatus]